MRIRLTCAVLLGVLLLAGFVKAAPTSAHAGEVSDAEAELLKHDRFLASIADDRETFASYISPDVHFLPPDLPRGHGREEFMAAAEALREADLEWGPDLAWVSRSGDLGVTIGTFHMMVPGPDGVRAKRVGKYKTVWGRRDDGQWWMISDMFNFDADAASVHKNIVYGMHGGLALLTDVYEPAESNGHALLFIAGSGWHWPTDFGAGGIKDAVASGVLGGGSHNVFADAGFTVFVINHRQAPLFRYPAAVEDARRAVRYIRHHGHEYGVTEEAIAAFGISSGAHLVLMLALEDGAGDPESADEVERHSSKVDVVAAYAGPSDLAAEDWVESIGASYVASFIGAPLGGFAGGAHAEASPSTYVDDDDPPVLLLHGDADEVVPVGQSQTLAASLREHQVEVEYVEIAGGGHDFDKVLNHDRNELPSFPAMARWLREHLPDAE